MDARYDVTEVVKEFLLGTYGRQRNELMAEFQQALVHNSTMKQLLAEIGQECVQMKATPVQVLAMSMQYGMTLGVLLEQERVRRQQHN